MPRIVVVKHCLTCPYGKYTHRVGLYCKITEELVACYDTVTAWDSITLKDLPDWVHGSCPLEEMPNGKR